jgi:YspA, cpYpsA-related SLOG family
MISRRALTAAMIDSRDFLAARRKANAELLAPAGPRIAFTGGIDCNDHVRIWDALDRLHARHPDMVLLHGGSPKGAERIAACWADTRKVPQVAFKPDWTRHATAAPFKRNDRMLEAMPIGVVAFPGSGISANLADKEGPRDPGLALQRAGSRRQRRRRLAPPSRTCGCNCIAWLGRSCLAEQKPCSFQRLHWDGHVLAHINPGCSTSPQ